MIRKYILNAFIFTFLVFGVVFAFCKYQNTISKDVHYFYLVQSEESSKIIDFYSYITKNLSKSDYYKFMKNFDKNSQNEIDLFFSRISLIMNAIEKKEDSIPLFTNKEVFNIKKYNRYLNKNFIKDEKTGYIIVGDLRFIDNNTDSHVFYSQQGVLSIRNKKYFKNKDILDVGAFTGDSALVLSKYTDGKIYSFEPVKENYSKLVKNIKINSAQNDIIPVNYALGNSIGNMDIFSSKDFSATSSFKYDYAGKNEKETVKITTIDDFVNNKNLKIGLIKSDAEGYEYEILKGAEKTIKAQKPVLLISIYHSPSDFFKIKDLIESWNLGYNFKIVKLRPSYVILETMLIAEPS